MSYYFYSVYSVKLCKTCIIIVIIHQLGEERMLLKARTRNGEPESGNEFSAVIRIKIQNTTKRLQDGKLYLKF